MKKFNLVLLQYRYNICIKCVKYFLMFYFAILVTKFFIMNSIHFEHPPKYKYPAIVLDMTNFMEHLSDENICERTVMDDGANTKPNTIDCKTEDSIYLRQISSLSEDGLEREVKVRQYDIEFFVFCNKRFW